MALRMGGTRTGKMVGEGLARAGMREDEAIERVLGLLEHCKVGRVSLDGTISMRESCESLWTSMYRKEFYSWKEPCCFFTTGFLNGFFSAVKNQHVKEVKCIGLGDPYCEWEFG
jgi:predicted hydrocarbon binding protein